VESYLNTIFQKHAGGVKGKIILGGGRVVAMITKAVNWGNGRPVVMQSGTIGSILSTERYVSGSVSLVDSITSMAAWVVLMQPAVGDW
jgi:hypothetical protein